MEKKLNNSVVVITGASSGIGRAAARAFALAGARVVLAARGLEALERAAEECRQLGAEAFAVATDVRDPSAVSALADAALAHFGRIDVWVNNAGVISYGSFEEVPAEVFDAIVQTNLLGQVYGCRAALPCFRRQEAGTLINVCSAWAQLTTPDTAAYVASKFALRAFSECLRQELSEVAGIQVVTIMPQAVDTPIFDHAANYSGLVPRAVPPVMRPERVADAIVAGARRPAGEVNVGLFGRSAGLMHSLAPRLFGRVVPSAFIAGTYGSEPAGDTSGNVLGSAGRQGVSGDWLNERKQDLATAFLSAAIAGLRGLVVGPNRSA